MSFSTHIAMIVILGCIAAASAYPRMAGSCVAPNSGPVHRAVPTDLPQAFTIDITPTIGRDGFEINVSGEPYKGVMMVSEAGEFFITEEAYSQLQYISCPAGEDDSVPAPSGEATSAVSHNSAEEKTSTSVLLDTTGVEAGTSFNVTITLLTAKDGEWYQVKETITA
mmetsp:Transcript_14386/g.34350  ORF Transcript_14386/g.34350 Transcript_14386/m.34350 type:complete len:167 (+) Transcript_14386:272-772(+)